jgi:hypothetical protein
MGTFWQGQCAQHGLIAEAGVPCGGVDGKKTCKFMSLMDRLDLASRSYQISSSTPPCQPKS